MAHLSEVRKDQLGFLPGELLNLLEQHYNVMLPGVRLLMVQSLRMMRVKNVVSPSLVIPVFFRLFRCKDKALRTFLTTAILGDLKQINLKQKSSKVNKQL